MRTFRFELFLLALVVAGAGVFVWQVLAAESAIAWQSFLLNLLFFSAVAQSGSVLAAIYHLTEARWGRDVMPLSIGLGSFLPISFVLFIVLFAGSPYLPSHLGESPVRRSWFDPAFLVTRELVGLALLYSVSLAFSYRFLGSLIQRELTYSSSTGMRGDRRAAGDTSLAILVLAGYAIVFSMVGFDLVMGLDHQWYSTLFGGYFFVSSFYTGLAATVVAVFVMRQFGDAKDQVETNALWDLGKLVFAFCLLTAYFFWAQYLVTWYGNLPEEVGFFIRRFQHPSWLWLTWTTIVLVFAIPFLALLNQRTKQNATLFFVALTVMVGMWLERYLLIVPSLDLDRTAYSGWTEAFITLSFVAAMALSYRAYLSYYDTFKSRRVLAAVQGARTG